VGGHRRRQDDRLRAAAPAGPQQAADQTDEQGRRRAVDDDLGAAVGVLERDRRVLGLALRIGLVGQQAADGEGRGRDLDGLHGAVGAEVGEREGGHARLADREVLGRDREDLAEALAGRLGLGLVDRDEVQRVEHEAEREVDGVAGRVGGGELELDEVADLGGIWGDLGGDGDGAVGCGRDVGGRANGRDGTSAPGRPGPGCRRGQVGCPRGQLRAGCPLGQLRRVQVGCPSGQAGRVWRGRCEEQRYEGQGGGHRRILRARRAKKWTRGFCQSSPQRIDMPSRRSLRSRASTRSRSSATCLR
jgi:hypothetical protein